MDVGESTLDVGEQTVGETTAIRFPLCTEVVVEALDDEDDLLQNSICPEYAPYAFLVDAVKNLLKIHVVHVQLPLPFRALFNDVEQSEDLVHASSSFFNTCLLMSKSQVHYF